MHASTDAQADRQTESPNFILYVDRSNRRVCIWFARELNGNNRLLFKLMSKKEWQSDNWQKFEYNGTTKQQTVTITAAEAAT